MENVLKQVESTITFLEKRVEKKEDFSDHTAKEELARIQRLRDDLIYFNSEY